MSLTCSCIINLCFGNGVGVGFENGAVVGAGIEWDWKLDLAGSVAIF